MAIILILVVLWGVVLGPGLFRRLRAREGHQSIDSFHHSLHLLERSAPPAFRLTSDGPAHMVTAAPSPAASARPRLVLLRPVGQGGEESMYDHSDDFVDEGSGERFERVPYERDEPESFGADPAVDGYERRMAAQRRRSIVLSLAGTIVISSLGGFIFPALWDLAILAIVMLVGYVGLMAYAVTQGMMGGTGHDRLIAHGIAYSDGYRDDYFDDDQDFGDDHDLWDEESANGWWDEPRRAASR